MMMSYMTTGDREQTVSKKPSITRARVSSSLHQSMTAVYLI